MDEKSQNHLKSRDDVFKAWMVQGAEFVGKYEFPLVKESKAIPQQAIPYDVISGIRHRDCWVHFYIYDYKFESLWNNPKNCLARLCGFQGVISPDFSLYRDMPLGMQIWNTYRNRVMAFWLQQQGIDVVPNVQWGDERSYEFCFDGIPKNSIVAISTNGCLRDDLDRYYYKKGLHELFRVINPKHLIVYSNMPEDISCLLEKQGVEFSHIENYHKTVRKGAV